MRLRTTALLLRFELSDERAGFLHDFIGDAHVSAIGVVDEPMADAAGLQLVDKVDGLLHRDRLVIVRVDDEDRFRRRADMRQRRRQPARVLDIAGDRRPQIAPRQRVELYDPATLTTPRMSSRAWSHPPVFGYGPSPSVAARDTI